MDNSRKYPLRDWMEPVLGTARTLVEAGAASVLPGYAAIRNTDNRIAADQELNANRLDQENTLRRLAIGAQLVVGRQAIGARLALGGVSALVQVATASRQREAATAAGSRAAGDTGPLARPGPRARDRPARA